MDEVKMSQRLSLCLIAFFVLLEFASADPILTTSSDTLTISGRLGADVFQGHFSIAAIQDVNNVTFEVSALLNKTKTAWILGNTTSIFPAKADISKGSAKDFFVTVKGIPSPDTYEGSIKISCDELPKESPLKLKLKVEAIKPNWKLNIAPRADHVYGVIGKTAFRYGFYVNASGTKITNLNFRPEDLFAANSACVINASDISVEPSTGSLRKGFGRQFNAFIKSVPSPGQYSGTISFGYDEQLSDMEERLPITICALKQSAQEAPITIRFVKHHIPYMSQDSVQSLIDVFTLGGSEPNSMIYEVLENTNLTLGKLTNEKNKTLQIDPSQVLDGSKISPRLRQKGNTLSASFVFKNPGNVSAGSYSGDIMVTSKDIGSPLYIPVVVKVRWPGWLAAIAIFLGVGLSLLFDWWNDRGKRITVVQSRAKKLRKKIQQLETSLPRKPYDDALADIDKALGQANDKIDDAENTIKSAEDNIDKAVADGKTFDAKFASLNNRMQDIRKSIREMYSAHEISDQRMPPFLDSINNSIKSIRIDYIETGVYTKFDEAETKLKEQEKLLDSLDGDGGLIPAYRNAYSIVSSLTNAEDKEAKTKELKGFVEQVLSLSDSDSAKAISENILGIAKISPKAPESVAGPAPSVGATAAAESARISSSIIRHLPWQIPKNLPPTVDCLSVQPRYSQKAGRAVSIEAMANDPEDDRIEYKFSVETDKGQPMACSGWLTRRKWIWTPEPKDTGKCKLKVDVRDESNKTAVGTPKEMEFEVVERGLLEDVGDLFTPNRRIKAFRILGYGVVILILGAIGYTSLYDSNPTFGDTFPLQEYAYLIMWGFGIQAATFSVPGVKERVLGQQPK